MVFIYVLGSRCRYLSLRFNVQLEAMGKTKDVIRMPLMRLQIRAVLISVFLSLLSFCIMWSQRYTLRHWDKVSKEIKPCSIKDSGNKDLITPPTDDMTETTESIFGN